VNKLKEAWEVANEKAQLRKNALSKFFVKYVFINFDICKIYFFKGVSD